MASELLLNHAAWDLQWDQELLTHVAAMGDNPSRQSVIDFWRKICMAILPLEDNGSFSVLDAEPSPPTPPTAAYSIVPVILNRRAAVGPLGEIIIVHTPIFLALCMGTGQPGEPAWDYARTELKTYCYNHIRQDQGVMPKVYAAISIGKHVRFGVYDVQDGSFDSLNRLAQVPEGQEMVEEHDTFSLGTEYDLGSAKLFLKAVCQRVLDFIYAGGSM